jgi:sigma-B regulation protein RsbU (phosphoserine phosphatase)
MIGDVSGHGYRAALIMALAMSASAIHAQSAKDPSEMLSLLLGSMREELSTTDMYISAFFGVMDHANAKLRFANTGHPHAFIMNADGEMRRLTADGPPLGLADEIAPAQSVPWQKGKDTLLLFTDGIVDSRSESGDRLGEAKVLEHIRKHRNKTPEEIVTAVFQLLSRHSGSAVNPDDLTLLVVRN